MGARGQRLAILRLDYILVHRSGVGHIGRESCIRRHEVILHTLGAFVSGHYGDARGIDAFFRGEIVLGIDGALRTYRGGAFTRAAGCFTHDDQVLIRMLLQRERDSVEAGLGFVVDARGALLVIAEVDGA